MGSPPVVPVVEEVAGLDVAVDDAERVHVPQRHQQRAHVLAHLLRVHVAHVLLPHITTNTVYSSYYNTYYKKDVGCDTL